jgi:hypothetical protein
MRFEDLRGQRFGNLVAIRKDESYKGEHTKWVCLCKCGRETSVFATNLKSLHTTSCGCEWRTGRQPSEIKEGTRFGHLTIIKSLGTRLLSYKGGSKHRQLLLCKCDCGNIKPIYLVDLLNGVKTCGCGKRGRGAEK